MGTLHVLSVNSVQSLFNYYTEQLECTPTLAEIQATNAMPIEAASESTENLKKEETKLEITKIKLVKVFIGKN